MQLADVKLGQAVTTVKKGPVQVIAVTAGHPQSGKTTIALQLARALARSGQRTMLLDADLGKSNIDSMLGLEPGHTLFDVLHGYCGLDEVIRNAGNGLKLIPAAAGIGQLSDLDSRECAGLVHAVSELQEPLDTLVVDTSSLFPECVASFCRAATEIIVLVDDAPTSINDSIAHMDVLASRFAIRNFRIIANRVDSASKGKHLFQYLLELCSDNHEYSISYTGHIPNGCHIEKIMTQRSSRMAVHSDSQASIAITGIAEKIMAWPVSDQAAGHLEFFIDRLIHNENTSVEVKA